MKPKCMSDRNNILSLSNNKKQYHLCWVAEYWHFWKNVIISDNIILKSLGFLSFFFLLVTQQKDQ